MPLTSADALIVIDVQNDFCPGGALAVADGDRVVPLVNRIAPAFAVRVFTQDWHPADHLSFAASHPGAAAFSSIEMPYGPQVLWPDHCVQGTPGADFHPDLDDRRRRPRGAQGLPPARSTATRPSSRTTARHADRPRRLPARPRRPAGLARRARHRLLRLLVGDRRRSATASTSRSSRTPAGRSTSTARSRPPCGRCARAGSVIAARGGPRMTDIATRVYDHTWRIDPIVRSLLDTDFYKLLMLQSVFRRHADVRVTFSLINRSRDVRSPGSSTRATCARSSTTSARSGSGAASRPGCAATPSTASAGCSAPTSWPGSTPSGCPTTGWSATATSTS